MKNFAELDAKVCSCTAALNAKLDGSNGKRAILQGRFIQPEAYRQRACTRPR